MREFPDTRFIVWTGAAKVGKVSLRQRVAALLRGREIGADSAKRARSFFEWVKNEWDEAGDNIYLWDFYKLETDGGLYMKEKYAASSTDSHPTKAYSEKIAPLICRRIVDVTEGRGDTTSITGE